jgi:sugar phosphate isomerase/epimerase
MKVGIDSYSFHRYFGEIYPDQPVDPGVRWDMARDFVEFARSQNVDEVAVEACFFPVHDAAYCRDLKSRLDDAGLSRVVGWGHPDGLHGGRDREALADLKRTIPMARKLGTQLMRIVACSMVHVEEPHEQLVRDSIVMLKEAVDVAREYDVTLALENHIDFTSGEILEILEGVGSDNLKVNFDTGNSLRLYEDPVAACRAVAPHIVSTHTKDITVRRGGAPSQRFLWWPSCTVGTGLVDIPALAWVLDEAGFTGSLAVEFDLFTPEEVNRPTADLVSASVAYLKSVVGTPVAAG